MTKKMTLLEVCTVFGVLYLPQYLFQFDRISGSEFNSLAYHILYIIVITPRIALLYLIIRFSPVSAGTDLQDTFGFHPIRFKNVGTALLFLPGIWAVMFPIVFLVTAAAPEISSAAGPMVDWQFNRPELIPLLFATFSCTGYFEEIFFRIYLIKRLETLGFGKIYAAGISTLLFSAGHLYQGILPFFMTAVIGIYLYAIFSRRKNVHEIALTHALYDATRLIMNLILS